MKKEINLEEALSSIPDVVAREIIRAQIVAYEAKIKFLEEENVTDSLTGLYNRRGFDRALEHSIALSNRQNTPLSLLIADLHGLKAHNDNYGRAAGDRAITTFADLLKQHSRGIDSLARWGGDEFGIILPGMPQSEHRSYIARMKFYVSQKKRIVTEIPFMAYWGIAQYKKGTADEFSDLVYKEMNKEKETIKKMFR